MDIVLKASGHIRKVKKYDLVFKITIPHLKEFFLLITFLNSLLMICFY